MTKRMKRQDQTEISDIGLISGIYKELLKINKKPAH